MSGSLQPWQVTAVRRAYGVLDVHTLAVCCGVELPEILAALGMTKAPPRWVRPKWQYGERRMPATVWDEDTGAACPGTHSGRA